MPFIRCNPAVAVLSQKTNSLVSWSQHAIPSMSLINRLASSIICFAPGMDKRCSGVPWRNDALPADRDREGLVPAPRGTGKLKPKIKLHFRTNRELVQASALVSAPTTLCADITVDMPPRTLCINDLPLTAFKLAWAESRRTCYQTSRALLFLQQRRRV